MKISNQLKQIRKSYLKIEPPLDFTKYGWQALRKEIEAQERRRSVLLPVPGRHVVFAMIGMVLLFGTSIGLVKAAQNSLPGDALYPIKRLSDNVAIAISSNKQTSIEKKAQEVVGVAEKKDDQVLLKNTVKEYQEAVSKTRQEVEKSGKKEEFNNKLKQQEQQFKDASKKVPAAKDILNEAIEVSKKGRDSQVRGIEKEILRDKAF